MCRGRRSTRLDETISIEDVGERQGSSKDMLDDVPRKKKKRKFRHWDAPKPKRPKKSVERCAHIDVKEHKAAITRRREFSGSLTPLEELEMELDDAELDAEVDAHQPLFPLKSRDALLQAPTTTSTSILPPSKAMRPLLPTPSQLPNHLPGQHVHLRDRPHLSSSAQLCLHLLHLLYLYLRFHLACSPSKRSYGKQAMQMSVNFVCLSRRNTSTNM